VAVPADGTATDLLGAPVAIASDGGTGSVTVGEVAGPVFLTFPNPPVEDAGADGGSADGSLATGDGQAGAGDAATEGDGGSGGPRASSGCGCHAVGPEGGGASVAGLVGVLWVAVARVRARRRLRRRAVENPWT
jgi:hypothetical protein